MKKRKNLPPKQLAQENAAITQFLFDVVRPNKEAKMPMRDVFEVYQDWRKKNKMAPTILSLDGFGRLFPHAYPRAYLYWPPSRRGMNCVTGMDLRWDI